MGRGPLVHSIPEDLVQIGDGRFQFGDFFVWWRVVDLGTTGIFERSISSATASHNMLNEGRYMNAGENCPQHLSFENGHF